MDTRIQLYQLAEYSELYGVKQNIEYVKDLLKDIPSTTLINYISGFNMFLYLNDQEYELQKEILRNLLGKMTTSDRNDILTRIKDAESKASTRYIFFWNYSNVLFYDLIFQLHNNLPCRDLTSAETKRFFDAYLIINEQANNEIDINNKDFQDALNGLGLEDLTVASFMQQRDYISNLDFRNQIIRGKKFFEYLDKHSLYGSKMPDYYSALGINNYSDIVFTIGLIVIMTNCVEKAFEQRKQIFEIPIDHKPLISESYLDSLCINEFVGKNKSYIKILKDRSLYRISPGQYYILDISNVINQLYKSQIFRLKAFLGDSEFLNIKAKEFSEEILLRDVLGKAFSSYSKFSVDNPDSKNNELCDCYIRNNNNICIVEFKDVMINDNDKTSKQVDTLFSALNIKFVKNQRGKPKGLKQLLNAISDIDENGISFDNDIPEKINIYPVIIYTDNSFGADGLNSHYRKVFSEEVNTNNMSVKNLVFINLSYFEMHWEYFANGSLELFSFIDEYNKHIQRDEYKMTPFEVFSRVYLKQKNIPDLPESDEFKQTLAEVMEKIPRPTQQS